MRVSGRSDVAIAETAGARSLIAVPMLKDNEVDRRDRHLPPGGSTLYRQADRAGQEFCRPSGDRNRECAAAQ